MAECVYMEDGNGDDAQSYFCKSCAKDFDSEMLSEVRDSPR